MWRWESFQLPHSLVQTGTSLPDHTPGPSVWCRAHCVWSSPPYLPCFSPPTPSCPNIRELRTRQVLANVEGGERTRWPNELDRCTRACVPASCRTSPRGQVAVPGFLFTENVGVHCCGPDSHVPSLSQLSLSALTTPQGWFGVCGLARFSCTATVRSLFRAREQ